MTDGVRVADYLTDWDLWRYPRTKAEWRRRKRGVKFPHGAKAGVVGGIQIMGRSVTVTISDGSRWRCYMRGGKTFRRRLKAPCPTIAARPPIDLRAFYGVGVRAESLESAQNVALANILKLTNEALEKHS